MTRAAGRPWDAAETERLRTMRAAGLSQAETAARLGRTVPSVGGRLETLGWTRRKAPDWTAADDDTLVTMLDNHHHYREIAAVLGRTEGAVVGRAGVLGVRLRDTNGYTLHRVATILGLACSKTVAWWASERWLRAHRTGAVFGRGEMRVVEHDDLCAFLADEAHWHLWEPAAIADAGLRDWCAEMRAGVTFLTTAEVGERLGLTHYAVSDLIRQGRLRAVKRGPNWVVPSTEVRYPEWLPRPGGKHLREEDRATIRRLWGELPATHIARRLGASGTAVGKAAKAMGMPPVGRGTWRRRAAEEGKPWGTWRSAAAVAGAG